MKRFLLDSLRRGVRQLTGRWLYLFAMVLVPIGCALFFEDFLSEGLPVNVPTGLVDMDHSSMSRQMARSLDAEEVITIKSEYESYTEAMAAVRRGEIFGFYLIPENFQSDALGQRTPTISYFSNMTYFVPGTFSYKGFKTIAVSTAGSIVQTVLVSTGLTSQQVAPLLQPVVFQGHSIGNPWTNYAYYLCPSFVFGVLSLMIVLVTVYSITMEIKNASSPQWLATAGGSIRMALMGKLLPQTLIFSAVALLIDSFLFQYCHFPMNGSHTAVIAALLLMVVACQAMGIFFVGLLPNPRLALSVASLLGILTFSLAGFSFPVASMYPALGIFSYLLPVRYFYLVYVNSGLNGFDVYFVRYCFAALLIFPLVACTVMGRLKRACQSPVYIP
jgi:ABC-2 type transport system permease protein